MLKLSAGIKKKNTCSMYKNGRFYEGGIQTLTMITIAMTF